jgi:hypothetical protein
MFLLDLHAGICHYNEAVCVVSFALLNWPSTCNSNLRLNLYSSEVVTLPHVQLNWSCNLIPVK